MKKTTSNVRINPPKILRGITPAQIKQLSLPKAHEMKVINRKGRSTKNTSIAGTERPLIPRPPTRLLTNLANDVMRLNLPEKGSFNPGLVKIPNQNKYILVYRPDEHHFVGCILDEKFTPGSYFKFKVTNCADPRLLWLPNNKLLMVYSSTTGVGLNYECIRGSIIMDLNKSLSFIDSYPFRISPEHIEVRQKNWMPFLHDGKIYLIASVSPHIIYEMQIDEQNNIVCEQKFETSWANPWFYPNDFLRGNTNPVMLDDGNYLGTFHTAVWNDKRCYYDNGCYLFEGKSPFKVLKCSNQTYLPADGAIEPHFRNGRTIVCTFPVGMVRENDKLLISYGDNDSAVKIMRVSVDKMLSLMLDIY